MLEMTPLERMKTAMMGGIPDRVPVFLRDLTLGLDVAGYSTPEVCAGAFDAVKSSRAVLATQRRLGHDAVVGSIQYCGLEVEQLGGKVNFPIQGIPSILQHPFRLPEDVERAEVPDAEREAPLANVVKAYSLTAQHLGKEVAIIGNVEGPLTKAGILRGMDMLAMDLVNDRGLAKKIVDFSTELALEFSNALARNGVNLAIFIAAASDNPDLFGPSDFREFTLPGLRRMVHTASSRGLPTIFHPHGIFTAGESAPLVDECIATGIRGFQFAEDNDLGQAKSRWGKSICTLGGVNAFTTLLMGPEERIRDETRQCIADGSRDGGFVLMCSCSLHRGIPLENIHCMIKTCERFGRY